MKTLKEYRQTIGNSKMLIGLVLVLALMLSLLPGTAFAEEELAEELIQEAEEVVEEEPAPEEEAVLPLPEEIAEEYLTEVEAAADEPMKAGEETDLLTEEIMEETEHLSADGTGTEDNDRLFERYFESLLRPRLRRPVGPTNLTDGYDLDLYYILSGRVITVAGEGGPAEFAVPLTDVGMTVFSWTKDDLGVDAILEKDESTGKYHLTEEAKAAILARLNVGNLDLIVHTLEQDYPYHMYWYDKTDPDGRAAIKSVSYSIDKWDSKTQTISVKDAKLTFRFKVAQDYRGSDQYEVDSVKTARAQTAAANAQSIVYAHAFEPTLEKLRSYKDEICSLTSYNYEAAAGGIAYGDPWQVIYVFDGDPETKVVCEGYAKAFEYLCDLSDPMLSCISVTGSMGGNHMWNIVTLDDGKNYLVDVTNCDTGMIGADDLLFLAGYSAGSVAEGYSFTCRSSTATYYYDRNTLELMTEEQLTLEPEADCSTYARVTRNLLLGENIFLNVNIRIKAGTSAEDYTLNAVYVNGEGKETACIGKLSDVARPLSSEQYRVVFDVATKEMNNIVNVTVQYKGKAACEPKELSVRDYCEEAAERYASNEKTVNLLKAILDYGAYAQLYFGYDTDHLANRNLSTGLVETTAVPRTDKSESIPCTGLRKSGSSLGLEAAFEMNTNFTPSGTASAEDMANYTFAIDGTAVLDPVLNNGRYTITLKDITAVTLGDMHTFTATHKDGSVYSVNDSPMGYLYRAYAGSSNVNLVHLCSAIYLYNQAAIAYFG